MENRNVLLWLQGLEDQARDDAMSERGCALILHNLVALRKNVNETIATVEKQIILKAGEKSFVVEGLGEVEIKKKTKRTAWDGEALRSAVLDSRLIDPTTGDPVDESPLDKVLAVWNLGAPRVTALRERGIQPDEFCEETPEGWGVKLP